MRVSRPSSPLFRGTWIATIALLAVLIQGLAAGAMAHTVSDKGLSLIVCSAQGATTVTLGRDGQAHVETGVSSGKLKGQSSGLPCQDCLGAATAAKISDPIATATPVLYARKAQVWHAVESVIRKQARAPPRPPSRAPPTA